MQLIRRLTWVVWLVVVVVVQPNAAAHADLADKAATLPAAEFPDTTLHFYSEHFPPYNYEQDGVAKGINSEIVLGMCHHAQLHCDVRFYPWLRAMENAQKDPAGGLFSIVKTNKRTPLFQWVGTLASSHSYLYKLKKRQDIQLSSLSDAKQFGIAVANGDIFQELLLEQGFVAGKNLLDFPTKSAPIELFLKGKVDLVIGSAVVMPAWLAPYKASMADVEQIMELVTLGNNYLALNLNVSADVRQRLQQALDSMKASGEYQHIIDSYHRFEATSIPTLPAETLNDASN